MAGNSTIVGVPRELTTQNRMGRAGVTPASSVPRIQFSTGTAKALSEFSFDMFQMSGRIEDERDQQASAEAEVEGAAAGATGTFEVRDYTTIRNRAYNQAGIQTFVSTLETRSIFGTAEIQRQYANDPAGMAAAMEQYHQGVADELNGVSPGAGAAYLQRAAARTVPAVERARDAAFTLTRDQADAMLIQSQVALNAELTSHAADLFSDNPDRSRAASNAVGVVGAELMRVYDAVDETTGLPLYSASERARAKADFTSTVFRQATLSWFSEQEDMAQAYLDFVAGDFKIDLHMTGPDFSRMPSNVSSAIANAATRHGVDADALGTIAYLESRFNTDAQNANSSAGGLFQFIDDTAETYGLEDRLDADQSSDAAARMMKDNIERLRGVLGREPTVGELYLAHQQGAGGASELLGNPNMLAVDLVGSDEVTLNGGRANMTAQQFANMWIRKAESVADRQPIDLRQAMSPEAVAALDSEMRSQISFANTHADRAQRDEDRAHTERQEVGFTLLTYSYLNGGQDGVEPLSEDMIQGMLEDQGISHAHARRALEWLATPPPDNSNQAVFEELQRRMYQGDDIEGDIQSSLEHLSRADASSLLAKNNTLNSETASGMTEEQRGYLSMIRQTVAPEGLLAQQDQGASMRAFNAQDEYRKRIAEGEDAATVAREIVDRAQRETVGFENSQIQRLLRPRFAVSEGEAGHINVQQTARSLEAAKAAGTISDESYQRQRALVMQWARFQGDVN